MEPIISFLQRRLKDAGPSTWEGIASAAGVAKTLPRKLAYGDRDNPGVQTVQPLLDFFASVDSGAIDLDSIAHAKSSKAASHG